MLYAQARDLIFTLMNGGGIRYDFNPRCSVEAGATHQHIFEFIAKFWPRIGAKIQQSHHFPESAYADSRD